MNSASFQPAISVTGLRKAYDEKVVLDGIDLTVAGGTIFALHIFAMITYRRKIS